MNKQSFVLRQACVFFIAVLWFAAVGVPHIATTPSAKAASQKCLPGVLKKRLAQIRKKFGKVTVISTFRRGARIRGTGRPSYHASCRAVDFNPPRGKYRAVARWLKANHSGGVGTYSCKMHHIHIDNGPRVRFHKCIR
ncbi:MAG: D-Ala-D-Ala carboxypeptidase family metallohydrolase [Pseudomonadota bacterium]